MKHGTRTLTQGTDDLTGTPGDDTFTAPLAQNELGGVTNTLASGDTMVGGEGTDELRAQLNVESTGVGSFSPVIAPVTESVENAFFQTQGTTPLIGRLNDAFDLTLEQGLESLDPELVVDAITDAAITIDAGDMQGVEQLWDFESRTDLVIEDVRSNPNATTIGMDGTDHNASYVVRYDADVIAGDFGDSAVTYEFSNLLNPADELDIGTAVEGWVDQLSFEIDGELVTLNGNDVAAATTYQELEAAVRASLDAQGYEDISVSLDESFTAPATVGGGAGAQLVLVDPEGRTLTEPQINVADAAPAGALYFNSDVGAPTEQDVETNVILDNVGRNDVGGILDIGGMSNKGVQVFNVEVDEKSWLAQMQSTSVSVDPDTNSFSHLEVVNIAHLDGGAEGDLAIGSQDECQTDVDPTSMPIGGRVMTNGLKDVRVFNAEGFSGAINLGASFTDEIFGRYLDDATDPVEFVYTGGEGGNLFTFDIAEDVSEDPFFNLTITGGASDDRFNLVGDDFDLSGISVDGEGGSNTLEVQTSIGTSTESTLAGFANIDKLVLAGGSDADDVDADMASLDGVSELVIATGSPDSTDTVDTTVSNLAADTTLVISGKNQTVCNANSDAEQYFGDIELVDAQGEEQLVTLDNTARVDGELSVESLTVTDGNVETLTLDSAGRRETSNTVRDIQAAMVGSLLFTGTQDLNAYVSELADDQELSIDGSELEGDLNLTVNALELEEDADDVITGTAGDNDRLTLFGNVGTVNPTVSGFETLQFGFFGGEEGSIGNADDEAFTGTYDAANTTGVSQNSYVVANIGSPSPSLSAADPAAAFVSDADLTLENLSSGAVINVTDNGIDTSTNGQANLVDVQTGLPVDVLTHIYLTDGSGEVNVNYTDASLNTAATLNADGDAPMHILAANDVDTVNIGLGDETEVENAFLIFGSPDSDVSTLSISGGENVGNFHLGQLGIYGRDVAGSDDLIDSDDGINVLDMETHQALTTLDFSDFTGDNLISGFEFDDNGSTGPTSDWGDTNQTPELGTDPQNKEIQVGGHELRFDLGGNPDGTNDFSNINDGEAFATRFVFNEDINEDATNPEHWVIDNFRAYDTTGGGQFGNVTADDATVLDFSNFAQLGSRTDLNFELGTWSDSGQSFTAGSSGNATMITADDPAGTGLDFQLVVLGVGDTDLISNAENLNFA
ncbi:MAG: hypothetical protein ACQEXG_14860 [Pseudomonadota bacterium]